MAGTTYERIVAQLRDQHRYDVDRLLLTLQPGE
jgi:hypothetical protein